MYRSYCEVLGVPARYLREMDQYLDNMLGHVNGRVYYNLLNWYRVIRLVPFYELNRTVMEIAMGVEERLDAELADSLHPFVAHSRADSARIRLRIALRFAWYFLTIGRWVARFRRHFYAVYERFEAISYNELTAGEVYLQVQALEREVLGRWGQMIVLEAVIALSFGIFHLLTRRWLPETLPAEGRMPLNLARVPANLATLQHLIRKRAELAQLLAYPDYADYITADKMVGSEKSAAAFIDQIVSASGPRAETEYKVLLDRKRKDVPDASVVNAWESNYYQELVKKSEYNFDAQNVRPYFPYDRVKQGVLDVTATLFGVQFKRAKDAPVWDPSVECFDVFDGGKLAGRFYLDMHPRDNKYSHAAQFDVHTGVVGRQIPEAALICNFPGGDPKDPGLMEHGDVHEFGHLLHSMFAGRHTWVGIGGIRTEQDFVEAPSQMLEEWTWDATVLATFAKHYQTGATIPAELVRQMKRANDYGKGLQVRRQMVYAQVSLSCYSRDPATLDTDALAREVTQRYQPFPFVEGTHFQCAFGHLDGYSAVYYTYMWSLVIAKDLFARFDAANLLEPQRAREYRETVLAAEAKIGKRQTEPTVVKNRVLPLP